MASSDTLNHVPPTHLPTHTHSLSLSHTHTDILAEMLLSRQIGGHSTDVLKYFLVRKTFWWLWAVHQVFVSVPTSLSQSVPGALCTQLYRHLHSSNKSQRSEIVIIVLNVTIVFCSFSQCSWTSVFPVISLSPENSHWFLSLNIIGVPLRPLGFSSLISRTQW